MGELKKRIHAVCAYSKDDDIAIIITTKCAICGGKVEEREVSEEVRIGNDFVIIENVRAGVCVECGERYYPPGIVDRLRDIERSIRDRKTLKKLTLIGSTYRLGYDTPV